MLAKEVSIAAELGRRRCALGASQASVASLAGLSQSHLSAIEKGKLDPRLSTVQDVARALRAELVLVPEDLLPAVRSLIGSPLESERRLFNAEPD
jgi:predicted transcriptional regulator